MKETKEKPRLEPGLSKAATRGVMWLFAQSISARVTGLFSQLVLASLLTPADFGIIGLAYTITGIAQSLISFGVDDVLLQRQKRMTYWSSAAFWISLSLGSVGMLTMMAAAPVAARVYHSRNLVEVILVLAVAMPIRTLATVPTVSIRLAMGFRFLAVYNSSEIVAVQLLTIGFAWLGFGALSFALPVPLAAMVKAVLFCRRSPPLTNRRPKQVQLLYMLSRSGVVFLTRTIISIVNQGDYIVLGLTATKSDVGLYYFAFRSAVQPIVMLSGNFTSVMLPAFAQLTDQPTRQANAVVRACRLLSYLVVPICFLQAALAGPGLLLLFGKRWQGSIHLMQLLSVGLPFDAVSWITGSLLTARGEFGRALRFAAASAPLFFGLVVSGAWLQGPIGVATAVVTYYMIYPPLCSILILRSNNVRVRTILELYLMPVLLAGPAVGLPYLISLSSILTGHNLLRVIVISTLSCMFYVSALVGLRRDILVESLQRFGEPLLRSRSFRWVLSARETS